MRQIVIPERRRWRSNGEGRAYTKFHSAPDSGNGFWAQHGWFHPA